MKRFQNSVETVRATSDRKIERDCEKRPSTLLEDQVVVKRERLFELLKEENLGERLSTTAIGSEKNNASAHVIRLYSRDAQ